MSLWDSAIAAKPTVSTRSGKAGIRRATERDYALLNDVNGLNASLLASEQEMVSPQVRF
jgi:hypothetical protein